MATERLLKWSKKAQKFFEDSADKSLDLTFMVSQANESQTGDGFEEFVNSINELNINRKIKKVIIIDTTFLYRHCIPDFFQHLDKNIPTMWFLNNENTIKINCNVLLESYVDQVNTDLFKEWHKKIVDDFSVVKDFKRLITQEAELFVSKGKGSFDECLNFFIRRVCSYMCIFKKQKYYLSNAIF